MPRSKVAFIFSHDKSPLVFGGGDYMGTINLSIKMRSIKNAWKIISAFQMCNLGIGKRGPSQIKSFLELTTRGLGIFSVMIPIQIRCQVSYHLVIRGLGIFLVMV
jgi:hypothetical protein